jgi:formylglycine-generating enzyme required for sulfatase activity
MRNIKELLLAVVFTPSIVLCNNIQVANVSMVDLNATTATLTFDVTWENSWRGGGAPNHDAAWIFVKYQLSNGGWYHATFPNTGHTVPANAELVAGLKEPNSSYSPTNQAVGFFLRRAADGSGTFTAYGVGLSWNYGGSSIAFNDIVAIKVLAIEMVHVTEGSFWLGSGGSESNAFRTGDSSYGSEVPFQMGSTSVTFNNTSSTTIWSENSAQSYPEYMIYSGPTGYSAFYCMKYEISQQQYVDFLNTLTRSQQNARTGTEIGTGTSSVAQPYVMSGTANIMDRNGIRCSANISPNGPIVFYCDLNGNGAGNDPDDGRWVACNYLSWHDVGAYLDWSGLRFMSEFEFEKACRGPLPPMPNEYPWGSASSASVPYAYSNMGANNEGIATGYANYQGNVNWANSTGPANGPLRVGIFSAHALNNGRTSSGASYYGIMEIAGNLREPAIYLSSPEGRSYNGTHGNGIITQDGNADALTWPPNYLPQLSQYPAAGMGYRGGSFIDPLGYLRISDRATAGTSGLERYKYNGGRGVRKAP